MIGSRQIKPRIAIIETELEVVAIGQQLGKPIFVSSVLTPYVVFSSGTFSKCYGYCTTGTFTCKVYFDAVLKFIVTDADHTTPVNLEAGQSGSVSPPVLVTFEITAASTGVQGIYVECAE